MAGGDGLGYHEQLMREAATQRQFNQSPLGHGFGETPNPFGNLANQLGQLGGHRQQQAFDPQPIRAKRKPEGIREELQEETDLWLMDVC